MINKFEEAKNKLVLKAVNYAAKYLLSKHGSAHIVGEPRIELTSTIDPNNSSFMFSGSISVTADSGALLNPVVGVNMTVNSNDIEVTSEDIPANINSALNAAEEHSTETVTASLDAFKLIDDGSKYLKVSHAALQDANLGIVGKQEYATSPDKSALLQGMLKDAVLNTPVTFTGEFKEPAIEKAARLKDCWKCGAEYDDKNKYQDDLCDKCRGAKSDKKASLVEEVKPQSTKTWLTADLDVAAAAPYFQDLSEEAQGKIMEYVAGYLGGDIPQEELSEEIDNFINIHNDGASIGAMLNNDFSFDKESAPIGIKEDMPRASMTDSMAHMAQAEEQVISASQEKIRTEAVNSLVAMLQGMGYGSAKVAEVTDSKDGLDIMAAIDDSGAVKAVSIPVTIKDAKVVLPKKSLISTLISKGLDIRAKLSEQFDLNVLEKMAAAEEKAAYEAQEVVAILTEKMVKTAGDEPKTQFLGTNEQIILNKHLISADISDLEIGNTVYIDGISYRLVSKHKDQLSRGEGDSSQWTFEKVTPVSK